ncbi:MAG: 50S ribosomal protein L18 [Bdellovibrionales bacterium]|nr:50S ribosomal protein L18 [Bdellovibrionales bacterium]MBL7669470.1 50S ribosomal protein L18 [Pseudobdellovibrionaceae bacterium]
MKLKMSKHTSARKQGRLTKKIRIRKTVNGSPERPRLCVFRSSSHMYAQVIDDTKGVTLVCASSLASDSKETGKKLAKFIGVQVAKKALELNIKNVVFDRNGYLYHGRVQALAEGAREGGLSF